MSHPLCQTCCPVQEQAIISTIEDFMWLKLHMVQPTAPSSSPNPRLSPNSSSNLLTPAYSLTNLQEEAVRWSPESFSQNGAQPLVYVVVLLLSQHFARAVEWMHSCPELQQHATHVVIALNHCQEQLLQQVITDSRAYGTLLGSGAIGDSGELS
ncbi:TPA: hypothetical protein ACH3X1_015516 [Trebouxia sp. C0004]